MLNLSGENVFIGIDMKYGRGLNIKFAKDSIVIVLCNDEANPIIHLTDAAQLAGEQRARHHNHTASVSPA